MANDRSWRWISWVILGIGGGVIYDPANPIRAYIATFLDFWLPSTTAFGVAFLFGGSAWLSRWWRRRAAP